MGIFTGADEKQRKANLRALEEKRVAFAGKFNDMGLRSEKALYGQVGGGFHGVALCKGEILYVTGPAPGEDGDFTLARHLSASVRAEDVFIASEGMGGMLGFGKKGGLGFKLILTFPDGTQGDVEIVAGQNCYLEIDKGDDPIFDLKPRRGNSNVVWDFHPAEQRAIKPLKLKWLALLGDQI